MWYLPSGGNQTPSVPGIQISAIHQGAKWVNPICINASVSIFHSLGSGLALKLPGSRNFVISSFIHLDHQRGRTHNHFSIV